MGNSTNSNHLSLFDDLEAEAREEAAKQRTESLQKQMEPVACLFCGERMRRGIMDFNHGIVFNGWCMKALMYHMRSKGRLHTHTEEARWLESHGIVPGCDEHDPIHWNHDLREQHFHKHFGQCYSGFEACR